MNPKATVSLSMIAVGFLLSFFIPVSTFLGAPLSLIALAYFRPYFSKKVTFGILLALFTANTVVELSTVLGSIVLLQNILCLIESPIWVSVVMLLSVSFTVYALSLRIADRIITRTKIRNKSF